VNLCFYDDIDKRFGSGGLCHDSLGNRKCIFGSAGSVTLSLYNILRGQEVLDIFLADHKLDTHANRV